MIKEKRALWAKLLVAAGLVIGGASIAPFAFTTAGASATESGTQSSGHVVGAEDLAAPIVGMSSGPVVNSYWLAAADGGVFSYDGAPFEGSLPGMGVRVSDIVGIAATSDGRGYWLVGADGGVFSFGGALFEGSIPGLGIHSTKIVGMAAGSDEGSYWLVGADGGVFSFGDGTFFGSIPELDVKVSNIVGTAGTLNGQGYWLVGAGGGVFSFGTATTLTDGYWYGNITSVNVAPQTLVFVPQCQATSSSFLSPVPFTSGSAELSIAPDATFDIYYRPGGDVSEGHGQPGDLQDVAGAVSEGLPDYPPGWYVTIENGVATNVEESSGIGPSPCSGG